MRDFPKILSSLAIRSFRARNEVPNRRLFEICADVVQEMAKDIDKIQRPKISAPRGDTFPVSRLTKVNTLKIILATAKPLILGAALSLAITDDDTLEFEKSLRELLRHEIGTSEASFGYSNAEDFPTGIRPIGRYPVEGDT